MLFKRYWLCDCLKLLIQLFEANFPCPDDQVFDMNKETQMIWKTVVATKNFLWVSLIQMMYRYLNNCLFNFTEFHIVFLRF